MNESIARNSTLPSKPKSDPKLAIAIVVIGIFLSVVTYFAVLEDSLLIVNIPQQCESVSPCGQANSMVVDCGFAPISTVCHDSFSLFSFQYWKFLTQQGWDHMRGMWLSFTN